nr:FeoB-associated Cys-rich membrane protein [uncultured Blautia sp.]
MLANIIIMALILGYCAFLIRKSIKDRKEGKHIGCSGCSGNCGSCGCGCSGYGNSGSSQISTRKRG